MSQITVTKYEVRFRSYRVEKDFVQPPDLVITEAQYDALKSSLNDVRFVEINGNTYNVNEIRTIERRVQEIERRPLGKIGSFKYYTLEEYEEYIANQNR